jgi:hypothetical protein
MPWILLPCVNRYYVYHMTNYRAATPTTPPHEIYEFTDSRQAEILARCCRVWISRDVLDPDCVHLAEAIIKVLHMTSSLSMDVVMCSAVLMPCPQRLH